MPRHPRLSPSVAEITGAVYSRLAAKLASHVGPVYPLHVGDTWMEPPEGCRMEDLRVAEHPGMHRYTAPQGHPALLAAIAESVQRRSGLGTGPDEVSNCTNRSPYPTLHLLREASIDRAVAAFPDPDVIVERNIATLEKLGREGWDELMR